MAMKISIGSDHAGFEQKQELAAYLREQGYEVMKRFAAALADVANVEKPAKLEGRNMLMFLASKPAKS